MKPKTTKHTANKAALATMRRDKSEGDVAMMIDTKAENDQAGEDLIGKDIAGESLPIG